ncbi:MAG: hypothetical protein E6J42_00650 [Chloroflexi bacterium]|nr:MAG: hypothetical protein E6J42_00650 [Chloroflexota bacterium]
MVTEPDAFRKRGRSPLKYPVRTVSCCDCEQSFPFSPEHQRLCDELGFDDPTRCSSCHRKRENFRRSAPLVAVRA